MKITRIIAFALCLFGILVFTSNDSAQTPPTPTPPTAPGTLHRGRHPAIHAAILALERAKAEMQGAAHDFGGHRVDAIAACDAAIAQLRLALQYAQANPQANPQTTPVPTPQ